MHAIIPVFEKTPELFGEAEGKALIARLVEERRWREAGLVEQLLAHQSLTLALVRDAQAQACRSASEVFDLSLSALAISEARRVLVANGVPVCAFFDDHVAMALMQRNAMAKLCLSLLDIISAAEPSPDILHGKSLQDFDAYIRAKIAEYGYEPPPHKENAAPLSEEDSGAAREIQGDVRSQADVDGSSPRC
jgi:hypothetical protein